MNPSFHTPTWRPWSRQMTARSNTWRSIHTTNGNTPAVGSLLLWQDEHTYLRLDRGSGGRHDVTFMG